MRTSPIPSTTGRYLLRSAAVIGAFGVAFILVCIVWSWRATRTYVIVYRLAPREGAVAPGDAQRAAELLARRLGLLGGDYHVSHAAARAMGPERVELRLKARSAPDEALAWATMPCRVEFRLVRAGPPLPGGRVPRGYVAKVYRDRLYNLSKAGDLETVRRRYLLGSKPALVVRHLQGASIATPGLHKLAVLTFRFGPQDARAFAAMTALNVGRAMAMLIDGQMFVPPKEIHGPITGGAVQISGYFQLPPLRKLVKMLNTGPLPCPLREVSRAVE